MPTYEDMQAQIKFQEQQLEEMKKAAELQRVKEKLINFKHVDLWQVTTEGDCEGRSVRDLGIHEGDIMHIAQTLADKEYYKLTFERVRPKENTIVPANKGQVHITVCGDDNIDDAEDLLAALSSRLVPDEKVEIGQFYKSVKLTWGEGR